MHGIRLAVMKCAESTELRQVFANVVSARIAKVISEGLEYGIEHGKAGRDLVDVKAYDPEANDKLVKALQDLKDLKYPMVDQLERLKDMPDGSSNHGRFPVFRRVLLGDALSRFVTSPDSPPTKDSRVPRASVLRRKRDNDDAEANAPPKVLRKDHVSSLTHSAYRGKFLATMGLGAGSISSTLSAQGAPTAAKSVSDSGPLSYTKPQPSSRGTATEIPTKHVATTKVNIQLSMGSPEFGKSTSVTTVVGSLGGIYQPRWGVTNDCRQDTPAVCQDTVDHIAPPRYFSELCHLPNADFLSQYNMNLARQVAMGSQVRLRFKQEVRLLKKSRAKIARRDQRIQVREEEIKKLDQEVKSLRATETEVHGLRNQTKNLETLLEADADIKKVAEAKNAELTKELESLRVWFSNLQVNNNQLSQQVSNLQAQITGEEKIKAAFEEFKKYEDARVEQRVLSRRNCANAVSAGIAKGISEGLKYGIEHGKADRDLVDVEAYDPEANDKLVKALQDLKDLKYPMVGQLERLKDAPMELIMASLHLEGDIGEDALWRIHDLRPSSSQLKILVYPEVRNLKDPWAVKEEMLLKDAIAANISRAEKKKKCRVVCRTYGIGSAHHARSDGIPVSAPTIVPQGLAILLADAATQTEAAGKEEEPHPRLQRSISLPYVYNL
ncbi:hypothetical protein Tco_1082289 [Tanacetum coccineum]|uniref:Uncharacterized protein n=1 Tax=Tanacetum coccineum TaxID=301880 RepID=A0ABQ5I022_9ASTR